MDARKKIELGGWAAQWTLTDVTGLADEQVLEMIIDFESSLADGIKNLVGWLHTRATRGSVRTLGKDT